MHKNTIQWTMAGLVGAVAMGAAHAQSADALIDKLVDKGILTVKEANQLREESDKGFSTSYSVKSGMSDWVTALKFNGDVRGRYEGFYNSDPAFQDRSRFRYRLRFGAVATLKDNFEVGMRLTSSEPVSGGGVGGDPISGNTTWTSNGSKKFVYFDLAYAKWTPINNSLWSSTFSVGKIENPFVFSDMVFDLDYTPEGFGQQFTFNASDAHTVKLNLGEFALREIGGGAHASRDSYLLGAQVRLDSQWNPKIQTTAGLSALSILNEDQLQTASLGKLDAAVVPNQNSGNSKTITSVPGSGVLPNFNPIVADAAITYSLASFPMYSGAFPIRLGGEYMNNPAASRLNEAYSVGVTFGKSGKKGLWEIGYRWKELQADAWWEELTDSDFGAFYKVPSVHTLDIGVPGYAAGTNVRGHIVKASYSPYDSLTLGLTYFCTEVIDRPTHDNPTMHRLQLDAVWKF